MSSSAAKLALGPVLFNWPTGLWRDFYARIADEAPVDCVSVGEVVCSKRSPLRTEALVEVIERLERAGKQVACATLALPTTPREIAAIRELADSNFLIEANDIATVKLLQGRPHIIGPFLNIYNEMTLARHIALGAIRICLPSELPFDAIRTLAAGNGAVEVLAFGRAPLALSARCYHARAHGLPKDHCAFVCEQDLDGLNVFTLDDRPFLTVNGVQTLGYVVTAATAQVAELSKAGVASFRLSPHSCDMVRVASIFRDVADGRVAPDEADAALARLNLPGPLSDGYLRGRPGSRLMRELD